MRKAKHQLISHDKSIVGSIVGYISLYFWGAQSYILKSNTEFSNLLYIIVKAASPPTSPNYFIWFLLRGTKKKSHSLKAILKSFQNSQFILKNYKYKWIRPLAFYSQTKLKKMTKAAIFNNTWNQRNCISLR